MNCPKCNSTKMKVVGSKNVNGRIRRRRSCQDCGYKFNTFEILDSELLDLTEGSSNTAEVPVESTSGDLDTKVILDCMKNLNRKLNILARYITEDNIVKPSSKLVAGFEQQFAQVHDATDDPDPKDIHAWALLIASLGRKKGKK